MSRSKTRAVILAALMVLSVAAGSIAFAGATAASGHNVHQVEDFGLEEEPRDDGPAADSLAEWSTAQSSLGSSSAHLLVDDSDSTPGDEARLVIEAGSVDVSTLGDLNTLSWEVLSNSEGYAPHVDVIIDTNGSGTSNGALVFEDARVDDCEAATSSTGPYTTFGTDDATEVTDSSMAWYSPGPPGPCSGSSFQANYTTLGDWKSGHTVQNTSITVDENTTVLRFEIEVDNWITDPNEAYVDDVTVNGDTYFGQIQDAADAAADGDTVQVGPGTYDEHVTVTTANLMLSGSGATVGVSSGAFTLNADGVEVAGFEITGVTDPGAAAVVTSPDHSGYLIRDNHIHDNELGVKFRSDGAAESTVSNNTFENNDLGNGDGVAKAINTGFGDSDAGLHNAAIVDNTFAGHVEGGDSYSVQLVADEGHTNVTISGNSMETTLAVNSVTGLTIENNTVDFADDNSTTALFLGGGVDDATIRSNDLKNASRGLGVFTMFGGPNGVLSIEDNRFEGNDLHVEDGQGVLDIKAVFDNNTYDRAVIAKDMNGDWEPFIWSDGQVKPEPEPETVHDHHHHHHHHAGGGGGTQVIERTVTVQAPSPTPREVVRTEVVERTVFEDRTVTVVQPSPTPREVERTVTVTVGPGQPGFGAAIAIVALLAAALLALRRHD